MRPIVFEMMTLKKVMLAAKPKDPDALILEFEGGWDMHRTALSRILPPDFERFCDSGKIHEFNIGTVRFGYDYDPEYLFDFQRFAKVQITPKTGEAIKIKVIYEVNRSSNPLNFSAGIIRERSPWTDDDGFVHEDVGALTPEDWAIVGRACRRDGSLFLGPFKDGQTDIFGSEDEDDITED